MDTYTREDSGRWLLAAYDRIDDSAPFDAIGCTVPVAEIDERVPFVQA